MSMFTTTSELYLEFKAKYPILHKIPIIEDILWKRFLKKNFEDC